MTNLEVLDETIATLSNVTKSLESLSTDIKDDAAQRRATDALFRTKSTLSAVLDTRDLLIGAGTLREKPKSKARIYLEVSGALDNLRRFTDHIGAYRVRDIPSLEVKAEGVIAKYISPVVLDAAIKFFETEEGRAIRAAGEVVQREMTRIGRAHAI